MPEAKNKINICHLSEIFTSAVGKRRTMFEYLFTKSFKSYVGACFVLFSLLVLYVYGKELCLTKDCRRTVGKRLKR